MEAGKVKMHIYNEGEFVLFSTYDKARAKDAELMQQLVDDVYELRNIIEMEGCGTEHGVESLAKASERGFIPTKHDQ